MMNLHAFTRPFAALAVVLAASSVAAPASAQSDEQRASARALATEGSAAFNEGRYKDAADLFARAESLVHAPPHLLFQARSYAKTGQFVKARETYMKVVKEQLPANAPQAFRDAQTSAHDELRGVEPKIARLTIQVTGGQDAKDLTVSVDGNPVPSVMIGIPQPVDPGQHSVTAVATGKRAQPQSVTLKDGERSAVTLKLEADPSALPPPGAVTAAVPGVAAPVATAPSSAAGPPPVVGEPTTDHGVSSGSNGMRIGSYVAFGVGAVGLGLGTVFTLKWSSKNSDADELYEDCPTDAQGRQACSDLVKAQILDLDDQAKSAGTLGIIGFAAGGVGIATGITLLVMSSGGSSSASAASPSWTPLIGLNYAGVAGTF